MSAGVTSSLFAIVLGQRDLLRVGLLLIALPLITTLIANRSRYLLSCTREISPPRIEVGQATTVTLTLENPGRIPTGLMLLEDQVPYVLGTRPRFVLDQLRPRWHRSMQYLVRSEVRGRFSVGPLRVRISDPFGFAELTRSFSSRSSLVVTPQVVALPGVRLSGDWSGTGDNRPRAFAAAGSEDVMVREYRLGDDLRRIHWRSTARADELMVRREEQPHQSRGTLLLDTRASAHRGAGPASSFEHAVSAVASIGAHLAAKGFTVRMLTDGAHNSTSAWHERGISGPAELQLLLDSLAIISTSSRHELVSGGEEHSSGLVVAVLGAITLTDLAALSRLRAGATRSLCILLDVAAWSTETKHDDNLSVQSRATSLRRQGWSVAVAGPGDKLPSLWSGFGDATTAAPSYGGDSDMTGVPAA
ncbi:MAG: DUF58 domain-containing protein [Nocardioidaceae bacterium]